MSQAAPARASFTVFGTTGTLLVTEPGRLPQALSLTRDLLQQVDLACSRFRPDSELAAVNRGGGAPVPVSALFADLLRAALRAAELTAGDVDLTCGQALVDAGYDADFAAVSRTATGATSVDPARPVGAARLGGLARRDGIRPGRHGMIRPGTDWRDVRLDASRRTVQVRPGTVLDLGSVGKAWAADRCAAAVTSAVGCGALVSLGGDIAVAGLPPSGGWQVRVSDDHAAPPGAPGQTVAVESGGLATSSTTVRSWTWRGKPAHHIIDPATGAPAGSCWRTVSVAAASCTDANTASTAAIIRGERAVPWLTGLGLPARLVLCDGTVTTTPGWPAATAAGRRGAMASDQPRPSALAADR